MGVFAAKPGQFRDLISNIFQFNWNTEWRVVIALVNLIHHMVSANSLLLIPALQLLVKSFLFKDKARAEQGALPVFNSFLDRPNDLFGLLHRSIRCLLSICPSGQSELFPILESNFPFNKDSSHDHSLYVSHLLIVCQYLPIQQSKLLELIVIKCIEIDVEIHIEESGEVKIKKPADFEEPDLLFENQDLNTFATSGNLNEVSEMADKLDNMMVLLLQFIDGKLAEDVANGVVRDRLFMQLLRIFEDHILMVHRSKFVQFLLFYIASKDNKFAQAFAKLLMNIFLDERNSFLKRQSAVVYLGSFFARATFLPLPYVR